MNGRTLTNLDDLKARLSPLPKEPGVAVRHPAFDVTPARLITAIITERGVLRPPYDSSIAAAVRG